MRRYPETEETLKIIRAAYARLDQGQVGALTEAAKVLNWPPHRVRQRGKQLGLSKTQKKFTDERALESNLGGRLREGRR
jgi:hypothetical protein